jgi:hypothetical protein
MHAAGMDKIKGYRIEMVEFVGEDPVPFAPSFGIFHSLLAAQKAASIRIALSAPRLRRIGYRIFDQDDRQVGSWSAARPTN